MQPMCDKIAIMEPEKEKGRYTKYGSPTKAMRVPEHLLEECHLWILEKMGDPHKLFIKRIAEKRIRQEARRLRLKREKENGLQSMRQTTGEN